MQSPASCFRSMRGTRHIPECEVRIRAYVEGKGLRKGAFFGGGERGLKVLMF